MLPFELCFMFSQGLLQLCEPPSVTGKIFTGREAELFFTVFSFKSLQTRPLADLKYSGLGGCFFSRERE